MSKPEAATVEATEENSVSSYVKLHNCSLSGTEMAMEEYWNVAWNRKGARLAL